MADVQAHRPARTHSGRLLQVWRSLPPERRLAAYACGGLFLTLFLPWYQETVVAVGRSASASLTGWQAFSFVEGAVLLVAVAVLVLLFQRAEGRAFHLPGGDGWVITVAGLWICALVVWRIFDKQSVSVRGPGASVSGVEWGIFVALCVGALLAYAGSRIRAAHQPEPPLPGDGGREPVVPVSPAPAAPPVSPAGGPSPAAAAARAPAAAAPAPQAPIPSTPSTERTRGWLSAPPKQRKQPPAEQLTIPLDEPHAADD